MKLKPKMQRWAAPCLLGALLAHGSGTAFAITDRIIATFDTDITVTHDDGGTPKTLAWSAVNNAGSGSGSLYATVTWTNVGGWQDSKIGITDAGGGDFAWPGIDCRQYVNIEFDVLVDTTNSSYAVDGSYGGIQVVFQGWGGANGNPNTISWSPLGTVGLTATNGWQHKSMSLAAYPYNLNKLVLNAYVNPGSNTIAYFIDNVKLTAPAAPPPTLQLAKAPPGGLTCVANGGYTYQRQIIRTANSTYSWNTTTAASNTTTYSFTLSDFPGKAYNGYIAQMFLVPQYVGGDNTTNNIVYNPTDSSIDWNSGSVIYFTVGQNNDGSATANWSYKTNEYSGQTMAQNDAPGGQYGTNGWPAGHLASLNCATGPLGTWSVSFNNNTNVTITAPNNATTNFTIPVLAASIFQDPLYAYFGTQPNADNRRGQSATFSRIKIDGVQVPLDDTFLASGPPYTLDSATWTKSADSPSGIMVTPPDGKFLVSWTTPDPGYTNIWCTDTISKNLANGEWVDAGAPQADWIINVDRRQALLTQSALDAALPGNTNRCFFGLWKVVTP